ncbi:MAG: argininosuccinate lyase [Myxococcota bacterium]|nr:argininosuccinate lyase [Myxococcota bacterium]
MSDTQYSWGGRFSSGPEAIVQRFNASVAFDQRLASQDLSGSRAHARMLHSVGLLTDGELSRLLEGLQAIEGEIRAGDFPWNEALEDVHMNIEARLVEQVGPVGKKLHTARSRNDQVATDVRLWIREEGARLIASLARLRRALIDGARAHVDVLLPGYTHLQRAQPVRLAHHLLAHEARLSRDAGRFKDAIRRQNKSPLGSGALSGTPHPIDRAHAALSMGFDGVTTNSLDAVAARDHLLELMAACSIASVGLSRLAEELVLWSSQEFGFVRLDDAYCTGSSMMPQKKNPDMPELIRGKTGRVLGDFVALSVAEKALPLAYNKDLQEDKEPLFDAVDTLRDCLDVMAGTIATAQFQPEAMGQALADGFLEATEVADLLVASGVPFREAHHRVGSLVGRLVAEGRRIPDLRDEEWQELGLDSQQARHRVQAEAMIEAKTQVGAVARDRVLQALEQADQRLDSE